MGNVQVLCVLYYYPILVVCVCRPHCTVFLSYTPWLQGRKTCRYIHLLRASELFTRGEWSAYSPIQKSLPQSPSGTQQFLSNISTRERKLLHGLNLFLLVFLWEAWEFAQRAIFLLRHRPTCHSNQRIFRERTAEMKVRGSSYLFYDSLRRNVISLNIRDKSQQSIQISSTYKVKI